MLKRYLILFFISFIFSLNIVFAQDTKAKIKNISLTGLFEDSNKDPYIITDYLLPVDKMTHKVEVSFDTSVFLIPFLTTIIKTTLEKEGKYYCDEVKIEYFSLALSKFYQNNAILKFKGYDEKGNIMPIDQVIEYKNADAVSSGWILKNDKFPADEVVFISKDYGNNQGATDRAWFIIKFLYPVSKPRALPEAGLQ
ncbi:MAG: hypothetical protein PHX78_00175 [bacterium]|nr:hypothetical protein [bacterium]